MDKSAYEQITAGFLLRSEQFLDGRVLVVDKNEMKELKEADYPKHGFRCYCIEDKSWWVFDIDNLPLVNANQPYAVGKWRLDESIIDTKLELVDGKIPEAVDPENPQPKEFNTQKDARKDRFYEFIDVISQYKLKKDGSSFLGVNDWRDLIFQHYTDNYGVNFSTEADAAGFGTVATLDKIKLVGITSVKDTAGNSIDFITKADKVYLAADAGVVIKDTDDPDTSGLEVDGVLTTWATLKDKKVSELIAKGRIIRTDAVNYQYDFKASVPFFTKDSTSTTATYFPVTKSSEITLKASTAADEVGLESIDSPYIKKLIDFGVFSFVVPASVSDHVLVRVMFTGDLGERLIYADNDLTTDMTTLWQFLGYDIKGNTQWRKMFPMDAYLDENSLNGLTNKAIAYELSKVAHHLKPNTEKSTEEIQVFELLDGRGEVLDTIYITASGSLVITPVVDLKFLVDGSAKKDKLLKEYKAAIAAGELSFTVDVTKTSKMPSEIQLWGPTDSSATASKLVTWNWDGSGSDTQTFTDSSLTIAVDKGIDPRYYFIKIVDEEETTTDYSQNKIVLKFVKKAVFDAVKYAADGSTSVASIKEVFIDDANQSVNSGNIVENAKIRYSYDYDNAELKALKGVGGCENELLLNLADIPLHNFDLRYEGVTAFDDLEITKEYADIAEMTADVDNIEANKYYYVLDADGSGNPALYKATADATLPTTTVVVNDGAPVAADAKDATKQGQAYKNGDVWYLAVAGTRFTGDDDCYRVYTFNLPITVENYYWVFEA